MWKQKDRKIEDWFRLHWSRRAEDNSLGLTDWWMDWLTTAHYLLEPKAVSQRWEARDWGQQYQQVTGSPEHELHCNSHFFSPSFFHSTGSGYRFWSRECVPRAPYPVLGRGSKGRWASIRIKGVISYGASAVVWGLSCSYCPSQSQNHITSTLKVGFLYMGNSHTGPNAVIWKRYGRKKLNTFKMWSWAWRHLSRAMSSNCPFAPLEGAQWIISQASDRKEKHSPGQMQKEGHKYNIGTTEAVGQWNQYVSALGTDRDITPLHVSHCHISTTEESSPLACWDWEVPVTGKFSFDTEIAQEVYERAGSCAQIISKHLSVMAHFLKLLICFVPVLGLPPSILPTPHLYETHIWHQTSCTSHMSGSLHWL